MAFRIKIYRTEHISSEFHSFLVFNFLSVALQYFQFRTFVPPSISTGGSVNLERAPQKSVEGKGW
jgi:hypothetical protein